MTTTLKPKTEAETLFANLDKPSLHALSYALRHRDTWPKNFTWNYKFCEECAMGLAHKLWANSIPQADPQTGASIMAREFALPYEAAMAIFYDANRCRLLGLFTTSMASVTPDMVAEKIDTYLRTAE